MLLPAAKALVLARLGNPTQANILETIETEMALVQETVLELNGRIVPWFLESEIATVVVTAGEERVAVPSDFVREKEDGSLFLYDADGEEPWSKLEKRDFDEIIAKHQNGTGTPEQYSLSGLYFRFRPIPEEDITLKMIYYAKATTVAGGSASFENVWLKYAPDLVIAETAKSIALHILQDFDLAATFDTPIQRAWDRVNVDTIARAEESRSRNFGEPS